MAKVLVVDDSPDNQMLMEAVLTNAEALVETASNGLEAIDKAKDGKFDAVIMDMQMPLCGGLEATKILRAIGCRSSIIALTAKSSPEEQDSCLSAGCDYFRIKPVDISEIVQLLEKICTMRK